AAGGPGGFGESHNGGIDGFVVKFDSSGEQVWSVFVGGSDAEILAGLAADGAGNVYAVGDTSSSGWTSNGDDDALGGQQDGFVVKLSSNGDHLWSSYVGGENADLARAVVLDGAGGVYVGGDTAFADWGSDGYDATYNG